MGQSFVKNVKLTTDQLMAAGAKLGLDEATMRRTSHGTGKRTRKHNDGSDGESDGSVRFEPQRLVLCFDDVL